MGVNEKDAIRSLRDQQRLIHFNEGLEAAAKLCEERAEILRRFKNGLGAIRFRDEAEELMAGATAIRAIKVATAIRSAK
jgi:hypothetical protein